MVTLKIGVGAEAAPPASVTADRMRVIVCLNMEGLCPEGDVLISGRRAASSRLVRDLHDMRTRLPGAVPQRTRGPSRARSPHSKRGSVRGTPENRRVR